MISWIFVLICILSGLGFVGNGFVIYFIVVKKWFYLLINVFIVFFVVVDFCVGFVILLFICVSKNILVYYSL